MFVTNSVMQLYESINSYLLDKCIALSNTGGGTFIRESTWEFPVIEGIHVLSIAMSVGNDPLVRSPIAGRQYADTGPFPKSSAGSTGGWLEGSPPRSSAACCSSGLKPTGRFPTFLRASSSSGLLLRVLTFSISMFGRNVPSGMGQRPCTAA